ncbi:carbohydrate ABC transporter permease [Paenibacillus doosanensis]|uniref:carbohydrate ABC transporter permease n=1 Tax=Paenibacillus doosanensis TaxID=1229154 RepID=UPI00217F4B29|nr:carbohydrate ABC transporter permease [Paenibacillus doosanensis]MCS7461442.1 carbohydrate ABC transporter permease [Paenibacillus doosanensis]
MRANPALQILKFFFLVFGALLIVFPMYVTVSLALKTTEESTKSLLGFPSHVYLGNFKKVLSTGKFTIFLSNSVLITVVSLIVMMIIIPMASFAISRNQKSKMFSFFFYFILFGIFVPFQVIMLPVLKHMSNLNLMNQLGLIIMYIALSITQGVFLSVGFLKNVPMELDEASRIDGCNIWDTFTRIIYPLMLPIIVTILILNSLWIWNDFNLPLILLNKHSNYWTLPLFIYNFKSEYSFDYNLAFAGFFLTMIPIIILYSFMQRYIISGLTEGALK